MSRNTEGVTRIARHGRRCLTLELSRCLQQDLADHRLLWLSLCDSLLVGCWLGAVRHRLSRLFSCFLVEGSRLSSPYSGRVEILNHSKETNWSQHTRDGDGQWQQLAQHSIKRQSYQWISLLLIGHRLTHNQRLTAAQIATHCNTLAR